MTGIDAGPLIAIIDADEVDHDACMRALDELALPWVTTWPAFTEAMSLMARSSGIGGQRALWRLIHNGHLVIVDLSSSTVDRSARPMDQCSDTPMDLADATLVAYAEQHGLRRIFSLDSDFDVYRLNGSQRFDVVPRW